MSAVAITNPDGTPRDVDAVHVDLLAHVDAGGSLDDEGAAVGVVYGPASRARIAHRQQRSLDLAAVLLDMAKAMLDTPRVRGGLWRRAVHSKNRRIRRRGEKGRKKAQAAADSVWRVLAAVRGEMQVARVLSQCPPKNARKGWTVKAPPGFEVGTVTVGKVDDSWPEEASWKRGATKRTRHGGVALADEARARLVALGLAPPLGEMPAGRNYREVGDLIEATREPLPAVELPGAPD